MPDLPDLINAPGARSLIRNGLMQNDLDANFHKILNLDTSNLVLGGPNPFPAQLHKWLKSYDDATQNFTATQPSILSDDIAGFPSITGNPNKFLRVNPAASGLIWSDTEASVTAGWVNVRDYGAVGNGTTDDYAAIMAAIGAAAGRTVYFPKGVYKISQNLANSDGSGFTNLTIVGDNPATSVLLANETTGDAMIRVGANSSISRMGFNGNITAGLGGSTIRNNRIGIGIVNATNVVIRDCFTVYCSSAGILVLACAGQVIIQNCWSGFNGGYGIYVVQAPNSIVINCVVSDCQNGPGIYFVNSQQSIIIGNQVFRCAHQSFSAILTTGVAGLTVADCDNTVIEGNEISGCGVGMIVANSGIRAAQLITYGHSVSGNIVFRNYFGGALLSLCNGFRFNGNTVIDNGQGGTDDATYTIEPGFIIRTAGSGYTVGQVLTVSGGTGTAAKLVVLAVGAGGSLLFVYPLSMGTYSVFPTPDANGTVGVNTGSARLIMTTSRILAAGTSYSRGLVLRSITAGHNGHPAKVVITGVNAGGGVTGYAVLDGGGYSIQPSALDFVLDGQTGVVIPGDPIGEIPEIPPPSEAPDAGFRIAPMWGKRFSWFNDGQKSFGVGTLGPIASGSVGDNIIDNNLGSGIQLMEIAGGDWEGRAQLLIISGNHILLNTTSIKGWEIGTPDLDCDITLNNMIANNFIYPADCSILDDVNTSPYT